MRRANLADVKNDLSRYVSAARRGVRVRILVRGVPAADLVPIEHHATPGEDDPSELAELERLGLARRGAGITPGDLRDLQRPGPAVRGGRAVEALLAERRGNR